MSNINLNDFWNKVREDIENTLPKEILESTILRLLPLTLDEASKTLTLTTMQAYIRDFIEKEPMINNAFRDSVNNIWQRLSKSNSTLTIILTTVGDKEPTIVSEPSEPAGIPVYTAEITNQTVATEQITPINKETLINDSYLENQTNTETAVKSNLDATNQFNTQNNEQQLNGYNQLAQRFGFSQIKEESSNSEPAAPIYDEPIQIVTQPPMNRTDSKRPYIPEEPAMGSDSLFPHLEVATSDTNTILNANNKSILQLNPTYTFDTFIPGGSSQMAYVAAQNIAENPATRYNPFFIYGKSGLGKTHLMHAIGNEIKRRYPELRIMCITSENFLNLFVQAIRFKKNEEFRNTFRKVDVLLIDDIQFIQDNRYAGTQMEFFHTFNALTESKKQIVLTSDTLPQNMDQMEDRLKTRFNSGLVVTIEPPNSETLEAITKSYVDKQRELLPDLRIPNEVIRFFGTTYYNRSVRDLQGALTKLISAAEMEQKLDQITVEYARYVLRDLIPETKETILSITYIQDFIADYFKIKKELLVGQKRNKQYAHPRQIAMYLCRELINESYPQISQAFGKKDHTTAIHAYTKISEDLEKNADLKRMISDIISKINGHT